MKKMLLPLLGVVLLLFACSQQQASPAREGGLAGNAQAQSFGDAHNARNSLDYYGVYVPRESDGGQAISRIELLNGDFYYINTSSGLSGSGAFSWDDKGSTIYLDNTPLGSLSFFVAEGYLRLSGPESLKGSIFVQR